MRVLRALTVAIAAVVIGLGTAPAGLAAEQRAPVVAAAADLNGALTEIAERFAREHGQRVELVFGSSGTLTRQIRDGAPFEIFLCADEEFVESLARDGLTRDRGVLYGTGRIVLFAPPWSQLVPGAGLEGLAGLVAGGQLTRFAIANPEHAPYGRAAEAALRKHGIWEAVKPRLVLGENASQAAQFATTGNVAGGIIAYSLALAPNMKDRGTFALIPESDHPPLRQRMVLLTRAGRVAERFYRYVQQPDARAILERFGFVIPQP